MTASPASSSSLRGGAAVAYLMLPVAVAQLWASYHADRHVVARNRLVEFYLPLVRLHARDISLHQPKCVRYDDLVSDGTVGLIQAIERYDPSRGVKFQTYSALRIRGAMLDGLQITEGVAGLFRRRGWKVSSLNALADPGSGFPETVGDELVSDDPPPGRSFDNADAVRFLTRGLDERMNAIVRLRYFGGCDLRRIGKLFGITVTRVAQIHQDIVRRMKAARVVELGW